MKIGIGDMTNLNGQLNLFLTAENFDDKMTLAALRNKLLPVNLKARQLDSDGISTEVLVIPLEHLIAQKYAVGTKVIFNSKHGKNPNSGKTAEVTTHGNGTDESGVAHGITFEGGHQMWAYPQELKPVKKQKFKPVQK